MATINVPEDVAAEFMNSIDAEEFEAQIKYVYSIYDNLMLSKQQIPDELEGLMNFMENLADIIRTYK